MSDEQINVETLQFTRHIALTIDAWPAATLLSDEWLKQAYLYGAKVEGDEVRFTIGNGESRYRLRRDLKRGKSFVAELLEGNTPANLASRRKKYEIGPE